MTYNEFIQQILDTRGRFNIPAEEYKERHHIIPECKGGPTEEWNLIDLYPEEHYTAHKMLFEENPNDYGIVSSFWQMCNCTAAAVNKRNYEVVPEDYKYARARFSELHSIYLKSIQSELKADCKGWYSEESRKKAIENSYISRRANGFKKTESFRIKISKANDGRHYYNNGEVNVFTYTCPEGFIKGRLLNYDDTNRIEATKRRQNKQVRCIETGIIYDSVKIAQEKTGATHIGDVCNGKCKTSGRLHWEFVDRSELKESSIQKLEN